MKPLNKDDLARAIVDFIRKENNSALFAGAGVGVRAGLPDWKQLLEHLANVAEKYDATEPEVIRKRAGSGFYLHAAQAYKSIPDIPESEKYKQIAEPFINPPKYENLKALVSLPFSAIFTTNYDRSLHHAYSAVAGKAAKCVELNDPTMKTAPYDLEFYIARIHGRAEVPESLVLDEKDYERLKSPEYIDLLQNCFTRYRCLFLGFSFLDPAIDHVFNIIDNQLKRNFPTLHVAVLPNDTNDKFINRLYNFNIQILYYDAGLDHSTLWEAIIQASREFSLEEKHQKPKIAIPLDSTKRFLSAAYARNKMADELMPLRDVVTDGIILDIVNNKSVIDIESLTHKLSGFLKLPEKECRSIAESRTRYMAGYGICNIDGETITFNSKLPNSLETDLIILVDGLTNRLYVRSGLNVDEHTKDVIQKLIEEILVTRGWDLGASYLGSTSIEEFDIYSNIRIIINKLGSEMLPQRKDAIALACKDLFGHPDDIESKVLAHLGRISFALQLVLITPNSTYTHNLTLPQKIYLDSNVLMRATVEGHPLRAIYADTIERMSAASKAAGFAVPIYVLPGFLDEVIAHRNHAISEVSKLGLEKPSALQNHLSYYGVDGVNVFIAAYSAKVGRAGNKIKFSDFLQQAAPYNNRNALVGYLNEMGISLHDFKITNESTPLFGNIYSTLRDAYNNDPRSKYNFKEPVLIESEARQLSQLELDQESGTRSLFVSGDIRLQKCCTGPALEKAGSSIISGRQFVQLMDLLLGIKTDPMATARLLWGTAPIVEDQLLLNYITDIALQHYDAAQAKTLPQVLPTLIPEIIEKAHKEKISLFPGGSLEDKARRATFLDGFEDRFYERMAEAMKKLDMDN